MWFFPCFNCPITEFFLRQVLCNTSPPRGKHDKRFFIKERAKVINSHIVTNLSRRITICLIFCNKGFNVPFILRTLRHWFQDVFFYASWLILIWWQGLSSSFTLDNFQQYFILVHHVAHYQLNLLDFILKAGNQLLPMSWSFSLWVLVGFFLITFFITYITKFLYHLFLGIQYPKGPFQAQFLFPNWFSVLSTRSNNFFLLWPTIVVVRAIFFNLGCCHLDILCH